MVLKVGSLFSGIGGLDLGLERAGMNVIWQSEIDEYSNKVLKKHWPEVPNHGNIKTIKWGNIEPINVICGGYPCQPFSSAGKRNGTSDPRHLWPWVKSAISELRPSYAILENVRGHLTLGGLQVIGQLAEIGYNAEWRIISAAGLGAPHRRDRVIIVAYPDNTRDRTPNSNLEREKSSCKQEQELDISWNRISGRGTNLADTASPRRKTLIQQTETIRATNVKQPNLQTRSSYDWWQVEPDVGRVANGVSDRVDKLRGLGNAVVPQLAEYVGRLVIDHWNNKGIAGGLEVF